MATNDPSPAAQIKALKSEIRRLKRIMVLDELTGLYNRRGLLEQLEKLIRRLRYRRGQTLSGLSVAMVDIDHFKTINDTYGHQAGDEVLAAFAGLLSDGVRVYDLVGRLGGEEFIIVYVNADQVAAVMRCEEIRHLVEDHSFAIPGHGAIKVTASFGVAEAGSDKAVSDLLARVDKALYRAKQSGRNQVVAAGRRMTHS